MEDGGEALAGFEQCFDRGEVERAVGREAAEDDGIRTEVAGEFDVGAHGEDFLRPIDEVAAARADHEGDLAGEEGACLGQDARAGGEASFGERGTEFDAVGTGFGAGEDGVEGIDADFKDHAGRVGEKRERGKGKCFGVSVNR